LHGGALRDPIKARGVSWIKVQTPATFSQLNLGYRSPETLKFAMYPAEVFSYSARLKLAALAAFACVMPLLISGPLLILSHNATEFQLGYLEVLNFTVPGIVAVTALSFFIALFRGNYFRFSVGIVVGTALLLYIEGALLNWDYGPLDGSPIDWKFFGARSFIDSLLCCSCLVLGVFIVRRSLSKSKALLVFLCLLQACTGGISVLRSGVPKNFDRVVPGSEPFFAFAPSKNIVVILLDEFQGLAYQHITEEEPEYGRPFEQFTFYSNVLGSYPTTHPSIPSLLSGEVYEAPESFKAYLARVLSGSLPVALYKAGYSTSLVTLPQFCPYMNLPSCSTVQDLGVTDRGANLRHNLLELLDLSFFRHLPHVLKAKVFNHNSWWLRGFEQPERGDAQQIWSKAFVDRFQREAHVDSSLNGTFKFIHLMLPHLPYQRDANCEFTKRKRQLSKAAAYIEAAKCALNLTNRLLDSMRALNVFSDATIVVLSDHGTSAVHPYLKWKDGFPSGLRRAFPLLLVKHAGRSGRSSDAPVQLIDLPRSVASEVGLENSFRGRDVKSVLPTETRTRWFYLYRWTQAFWLKDELPPIRTFEINGDARDFQNWREITEQRKDVPAQVGN